MKRLLPLLALAASPALALENAVPAPFPADRYEKMAEQKGDKALFSLATPTAAPPVSQPGYAENWYLTGVGRDPEGREFVTIIAKDGSAHFSLLGNEAYADQNSPAFGVSLVGITWSDIPGESKANIVKGGVHADLVFSKEPTPVAVVPQPNGQPPRPGLPGQLGITALARPGTPGAPQQIQPRIALPRPSTAPVVNPPPPVNGGQPAGAQPAGQDRRRIRNIAAPQ